MMRFLHPYSYFLTHSLLCSYSLTLTSILALSRIPSHYLSLFNYLFPLLLMAISVFCCIFAN